MKIFLISFILLFAKTNFGQSGFFVDSITGKFTYIKISNIDSLLADQIYKNSSLAILKFGFVVNPD